MAVQTAEPWYVDQKRQRKAVTLADACRAAGLDPTTVTRLEDAGRRRIEAAAGTGKRSPTTWRLVASLLAGSVTARCPFCGMGNPDGDYGPPLDYGHAGPCNR